jgi:hypothetical protein
MLNKITFLSNDIGGGVAALTVCIDGIRLSDLAKAFETAKGYNDPAGGYGGIVPAHSRLGPLDSYFLGLEEPVEAGGPGEIYALFCECGEAGCWPLTARVAISPESVRWGGFSQPHRLARDYSDFGPFTFDREQYVAAVAQAESLVGSN